MVGAWVEMKEGYQHLMSFSHMTKSTLEEMIGVDGVTHLTRK